MKIFITGITGFVGSHFVDYLLKNEKIEIHGLARWRSPKDNINHCLDKINLHYGDLLDFSSLYNILKKIKPEYISHLAAQSVAESEFIPILKSKEMMVVTFEELWKTLSIKYSPVTIVNNGIETEVINIKGKQIRAITFFNGMGNWIPIKQISRHKYKGDIVKLNQKFGSILVTPNHCIVDRYSKQCSPLDNPDLLAVRKLNYQCDKKNKNMLKIKVGKKKYCYDEKYFWNKKSPERKLFIKLKNEKLRAFLLFCAAYVAEGCAYSRKNKNNKIITISNNDKKWLEEINEFSKQFMVNIKGRFASSKKENYKPTYNLCFTSDILYDVIVNFCGKGSKNKQIPYCLFQMDLSMQNLFLKKLIEGDGCYDKRKKCDICRYTTKSRKLASQLSLLFTLINKDYTVYEDSVNCFHIRECKSYQPNQGINKKKIKKFNYDGYVYDISVGTPELFAIGVGNIIVHNSYVPYSFNAPASTLDVNGIGTCNLLEAIKILKEENGYNPIVHICSSSEVYGQVEEKNIPITEDCPLNPASPYAVSKVCEDMLALQYWLSYKIKTIRTRMFTHTAPRRGEVFVVANFVKQIVEIEKKIREPIVYVGNLDSVRTFADARDTVEAYWLLMNMCEPGDVYNIGGKVTMTIKEMLNKLIQLSKVNDIKVVVDQKRLRPSDVTLQIPCIDKFQKITGWEPKILFNTTLKDMLNYWRKKYV